MCFNFSFKTRENQCSVCKSIFILAYRIRISVIFGWQDNCILLTGKKTKRGLLRHHDFTTLKHAVCKNDAVLVEIYASKIVSHSRSV